MRERFYHGTSLDAAGVIVQEGFRLDMPQAHDVGDFGQGIYLTHELARAQSYGRAILTVEADVTHCARVPNPYFLDGLRTVEPRTEAERLFFLIAFDSAGRMRTCGPHVQAAARAHAAHELREAFLDAGYTGIVTDRPDGEAVIFDLAAVRVVEIVQRRAA